MRHKECLNDVLYGDILLPRTYDTDNYKITSWPKDNHNNCTNARKAFYPYAHKAKWPKIVQRPKLVFENYLDGDSFFSVK